jgi:hypothetical protein
MRSRLFAFLLPYAIAVAACPGYAAADAQALRTKHAELRSQLASNPFLSPIHVISSEKSDSISGSVYAVVAQPFAAASPALQRPASWCDILILHLNTKYCRAGGDAPAKLDLAVGGKYDQPLEDAYRMDFTFRVAQKSSDYLQVALDAGKGPLSTRDYRIVFEAVPLDRARSFIHLSYSYAYGIAGRLAAQAYLGTAGSGKVGFTEVGTQPGGEPKYIGGMRGVIERNAMRYYLAVEAYLGALSAPPQERVEKSLRDWFAATERFARQLHELGQAEYLDMKRREYQRQS